jgi:hypothetical protein
MGNIGYFLYLFFTASWFLHLTARLPVLGVVRADLLLVLAIFALSFMSGEKRDFSKDICYKRLVLLIFVIIVITPFAEWPGSVVKFGLPNYIKAVVFFFFSVWYLTNEKRIKLFVLVFVLCQSFRVLEPLYLHITQGYWGSRASMGNWESMDRLAGAPFDVINPNGLAFVILSIIPFLLVFYRENKLWKIIGLTVGPASLYALYLTASRSGMLGLVFILLVFTLQSKNKIPILVAIVMIGSFAVSNMQGDFKDRYLSIIDSDTKNARTAQGRINGLLNDFKIGMHRPIFGFGLGTSLEANANFGGEAMPSHCIYTETFQEIGIVGLFLFLMYIWSIVKYQLINRKNANDNYIDNLSKVVLLLSLMNIFFGLASYGLSSYEWYFLGGLSVVINEYLGKKPNEEEYTPDCEVAGRGHQNFHPLRLS